MPKFTLKDGSERNINIAAAGLEDIPALMSLNQQWQKSSLQDTGNGYVGAAFSNETFTELIKRRQVVVAYDGAILAGYYLLNDYSKEGIIGRHEDIVNELQASGVIAASLKIGIGAQTIVDTPYMGSGIGRAMLHELANAINGRFDELFGTIAKDNPRSLKAHTGMGFRIVGKEAGLYYVLYPLTL